MKKNNLESSDAVMARIEKARASVSNKQTIAESKLKNKRIDIRLSSAELDIVNNLIARTGMTKTKLLIDGLILCLKLGNHNELLAQIDADRVDQTLRAYTLKE